MFQLVDPALPNNFPALRTLENRSTNLPIQATSLVGRQHELSDITGLLRRSDVRLVTLTGPGGTGKTRLALQTAADLLEEYPHGVFFVGLAAITDPALVVPAIAQAIGINESAGQSLFAYLKTKRLLLVIDNLEQVIEAARSLADLLAEAPDVKLLVTSREPLRVAAEHVYPVPPLALPDPHRLADLSTLSQYGAVALFIERAQAVQPSFEVTTANAPAVAEICMRLDGLPLALELAAARITLLSPDAMLVRLGERLKLLRSSARDIPARQQTLHSTLTWSYDLLNPEEQQLFARLSIFSGGFTLEAAESVCEAELDTLESLVDKSLIRRVGERFALLETVREYALEQLATSDDRETVGRRHAAFFTDLVDHAFLDRFEHEGRRSDQLEADHDNLRTAIDSLSMAAPRLRLRLVGRLGWFWHVHSHLSEGRARLKAALDGSLERDDDHAQGLAAAAELAAWQGDTEDARRLTEEAVAIWRGLDRVQEIALALHELGWGYFFVSNDAESLRCMEESLELQRSLGQPLLLNRAQTGLLQVLVSAGELDTVEALAPEALKLAHELGDPRSEHFAHHMLADCPLIRGDCASAEPRYHRALQLAVELRDRSETAIEIQGMAMAAAGNAHPERALRLAGAASAELDALGIDISGTRFWQELLDRYLGMARSDVPEDVAAGAWEQGRHMTLEQATEEALALSQ